MYMYISVSKHTVNILYEAVHNELDEEGIKQKEKEKKGGPAGVLTSSCICTCNARSNYRVSMSFGPASM